ncbi:MAG: DUF6444 domain-containing protein [Planctomycetota bacterium]|nr:DUF6444 domain-containing protein [Planctomycetota bacterium]
MITETDFDSLPDWAKEQVTTLLQSIEMTKEQVGRQEARIGKLRNRKREIEAEIAFNRVRVADLERQLWQQSNNDSMPPSEDPLFKARQLLSIIRSKKILSNQPGYKVNDE